MIRQDVLKNLYHIPFPNIGSRLGSPQRQLLRVSHKLAEGMACFFTVPKTA